MRRLILKLVFGIGMPLLTAVASAQTVANPGVLPPSAMPHGHSYGEWSAAWWQWALSAATPVNPVLDTTGENCAEGQDEKVWFLAGSFSSDPVTRSCTVSAGTALFFPIVNTFLADEGTVEQMRAAVGEFIDSVVTMSVSIDGEPVENLETYRAISPVFSLTLPSDNIFGVPEGIYAPAVSDGYWLLLAPLPPGTHVIHFSATTAGGFSLDITYNLTVEAGT